MESANRTRCRCDRCNRVPRRREGRSPPSRGPSRNRGIGLYGGAHDLGRAAGVGPCRLPVGDVDDRVGVRCGCRCSGNHDRTATVRTRTPYGHVERAYAHLTKACSQLHDETGRVSGSGNVALFGAVKAATDTTETVWKATGEALNAVREARDAGLRFDARSKVEGLSRTARQNVGEAHRCFFEDSRDQRKVRLQACIDALEQLTECDRGELQAYFNSGRRLDELLAVFRAATDVKDLRIAERGFARPTSGDADLFADEVIRKVLWLRRKIAHRPT